MKNMTFSSLKIWHQKTGIKIRPIYMIHGKMTLFSPILSKIYHMQSALFQWKWKYDQNTTILGICSTQEGIIKVKLRSESSWEHA